MKTQGLFRWLSIWIFLGLLASLAAPIATVQAAAQPAAQALPSAAVAFNCSTVSEISNSECQALATLYSATNGDGWTNHTGWLTTATPCTWFGVSCSGGHVNTINLNANQLTGTIPPEIANLPSLFALLLQHNQISGSIPPELGSLASLRYLQLWGNLLSGPIPSELGSLTKVAYMMLYSNQLSGAIPAEIGNMSSLIYADFSNNQFCGSIPGSLGVLATLNDLRLSGNHLFIPGEPLLSQLNAKTPNDRNWTVNQTAGECSTGKTLLAIYVLAFDNGAQSTFNLSGYFKATMQSIASATTARPAVRAVVLSDLDGPDNVAVYEINTGVVTQVTTNLPALSESTVIDGTELGGFLAWARATYPADQVSMYFVGHDKPVPQEGLNATSPNNAIMAVQAPLFPLPIRDGAHPDYTDATPTTDVLSIYDLAEALRQASLDGTQPIDLVDLSSCFALSFEETYPLRNFTRTIVGSPNYAFFEPALAGAFLQAQQAGLSARDHATAVVNAEDAILPASSHPRMIIAIDTSKLDALKDAWDAVSYNLWLGLNDPAQRQSFKDKLVYAYQTSNKFDTTFCEPQDWALETPDALVDLHSFAARLRVAFGSTSAVGIAANNAFTVLYQVLITRTAHNGTPWFGNPNKTWNFDSSLGLSLYVDLVGQNDSQGHILLNDIAPWYTREISDYNQHPYEFVQTGAYGQEIQPAGINWADVFTLFWRDNTNLQTKMCLPSFPPVAEPGDLIAGSVISPLPGTTYLGNPVTLSATVKSTNDAHNVQVAFYVVQNSQTILTNIINVPFIAAGTVVTATADQTWTPATTGPFTIYFVVDPDRHYQESNRSNNYAFLNDTVKDNLAYPRPEIDVALSNGQQWWPASPVQLAGSQKAETITTDPSRVNKLVVEFYQYQPGVNPTSQVPFKVATQTIEPVSLPQTGLPVDLPASLDPGIVVLHIWPYSDGGGIGKGQEVTFNYTPANASLANLQAQYFSFKAAAGDPIELNLLVTSGSTRMYVWMPGNSWSAQYIAGSGTITIDPALEGTYLVCVLGKSDNTQYTLFGSRNNAPLSPGFEAGPASNESDGTSTPVITEARARPDFSQPPLSIPLTFQLFLPRIAR